MIRPQRGLLALALLLLLGAAPARSVDFLTFETGPVRPLATSDDGSRLYSVNTPDNRLEIFDVTDQGLIAAGSLQVGMEPCAVAVAPDGTVWVIVIVRDPKLVEY